MKLPLPLCAVHTGMITISDIRALIITIGVLINDIGLIMWIEHLFHHGVRTKTMKIVLAPIKRFDGKHLRKLFLMEAFYYLNPLHMAWNTCTQYGAPNAESRKTMPLVFSGGHGLHMIESCPACSSVPHHSQYLGQVRVGRVVLRVSCVSQAASYTGNTLHGKRNTL